MARRGALLTAIHGTFSEDGKTIADRWEIQEAGSWKTDFELTYTKVE